MRKIPCALFNSKALFNPYQYKPFFSCMEYDEINGWKWNGNNLFITDEVGVGKTFEVGIILQELLKKNNNLTVLVISPPRLCENWEKEMRENFFLAFNNYKKTKIFRQMTILPYSYFDDDCKIVDKGNSQNLSNWNTPKYDILILDEAHYIRNKGKRHQYISAMVKNNEKEKKDSKLKIFLTATPIFNAESDYNNIISPLTYNNQTFSTTTTLQGEANCYDFQLEINMQSVTMNDKENTIIKEIYREIYHENGVLCSKYGLLTGLLKRISASSFYSLREFVNNRTDFFQFEKDELLDAYDNDTTELIALQSLCNEWSEDEDSKLAQLFGLIKRLSGKIVIFSCFLNTCDYLEQKLKKKKYTVYKATGKTSATEMTRIISCFKNTNEKAILICSDAVKEGQNFQFCQNLIHYDFPFTPAAIGQRNGRIYRKGQKGIPKVYYMFTNNTYDERLFGEIIVTKTRIVKKVSEQGLVSTLDVLPNDSNDYFKECINAYFNDLVSMQKNEDNDKNNSSPSEEKKYSPEQKVFRCILRKQFSHMVKNENGENECVWELDYAKKVYKEDLPNPAKCCDELINIIKMLIPEKQGQVLKDTYINKYKEEMIKFNSVVFGCEDEDIKKHCQDVLCESLDDGCYQKFCHDMLENTEMTLEEYKKQFIPLLTLSKGGNEDE